MNCPRCQAQGEESRTEVLETRNEGRGGQAALRVRRRRRCPACAYRFTTFELAQLGAVRSPTGLTSPFDEEKLMQSLIAANEDIGIGELELAGAVDAVRAKIETRPEPVDVAEIDRWLGEALKRHPDLLAAHRDRVRAKHSEGWVRKINGRIEAFSPEKLRAALRDAVHSRINESTLDRLVKTIEERVADANPEPVPTKLIRTWVEEELRATDPFAYLRVASTAPDVDLDSLRRQLLEAIESGLVRKRDSRCEVFSRQKLIISVRKATVKRQTISDEETRLFADEVAERVRKVGEPVPSDRIGDWVLDWLKRKDAVASMSFLLVFKPPDSPRSLERELEDWGISHDR
ncbi:MAG TPA: ATP cone domain-containing protein [Solirubrobacterales bacterium]|nr:ATP cone domain-containing protein [Solirubrobacterales bacterium]